MRKQIAWLWENMDAPFRRRHIIALCISAFTCLLLLVNPALSQRLIDDVIMAQNPEPLLPILAVMLVVKLGREGLRYMMVIFLETDSQNVIFNLRRRLFAKMQYNDMRFFDSHRTGDLMTRMSADLDWCRHFLSYIDFHILDAVCTFVFATVYLTIVNWKLTLLLIAITPVLLIITKLFSKHVRPRFVFMREKLSEMNTAAQENIAGNRVVKAFAREEYEKEVEKEVEERERERKKKSRKKAAIIIAVLLVLAAAGAGFAAWRMGAFSDTKAAPDLLDMTLEEATAYAEEEGFRLKQGKDIYSSDYAEGRVCLQDPEPGSEMPKGGVIKINLSKGSKEGMVPNVVGMYENEVEGYLKEHGYVLGNVKVITSPEEEGLVLEQSPAAGTSLDKESKIDIVVSDGEGVEKASVPSVTRMPLEDAKKEITSAGFEVGNITYDYNESIGKGYVTYQQWQAGMMLEKGTTIDLEVSQGPEPKPSDQTTPAAEEKKEEKKE